ncbi:peptidylprolyl isomerase [Paenibacillus flagellatus]|uniref:Peptidyl-prolyl cis-trans isomerase n=2 Tax=Paenibacillus flagellatus TaxID=2211139 RepID=A0A2V5JVP6_9BACL|nr:peptidylprolyl isomerase [Paenibacillus flagellatus]
MGLIIGVLLSVSFVQASGTGTSIEVYFKELRYLFDGVEKKPEQDGFIYNGTTYVPLRFVGEALGKRVQYDDDTGTIKVGHQYAADPAMTIDQAKTYRANVTTTKGSFVIELFAKDAPKAVNNFVFLAGDGYYEDVPFHRIIESFMIQTGDPTGTGAGDPGYSFADELNNGHKYEPGVVAMANAGPNTNGSQFFICTGAESELLNNNPDYTIFGKVVEGMDVVKAIAATPVAPNAYGETSQPKEEVKIERIDITVQP